MEPCDHRRGAYGRMCGENVRMVGSIPWMCANYFDDDAVASFL
jgi:hypothetical protein